MIKFLLKLFKTEKKEYIEFDDLVFPRWAEDLWAI